MAEKLETLYIELRADQKKLKKEIQSIRRETANQGEKMGKGFGAGFKKGFIAIGGLLAFKKLLDFSTIAKNAARDAEEIRSKFDTVFSSMVKGANKSAAAFSESFKLASSTTKELLGNTGDLLVGFGFQEKAALDLSVQVNTLAQDLASFTNFSGGAKGASAALTKALLGETESAKSLGIVIRQNTDEFRTQVKQVAETQGLTEQQAKAIVILEQAYTQSTKAVGDFARTEQSLANQERILAERNKELIEQFGNELIPIYQTLIFWVSELGNNMGDSSSSMSAFGVAARSVATPVIILGTVVKEVANILGTLGANLAKVLVGDFDGVVDVWSQGWEIIAKDAETAFDAINKLWEESPVTGGTGFTPTSFTPTPFTPTPFTVEASTDDIPTRPSVDTDLGTGFRQLTEIEQEMSDLTDQLADDFNDGMIDASDSFNSNMLNGAQSFGNLLMSTLGIAADSFVGVLTDGIGIVTQLLGIVSQFTPGGFVTGLFAHKGGTFEGGSKVASFAGGGDFTVPGGYANDSFPMLVESGERVQVTPSNRVGEETKLLAQMIGRLDALNMNLVDKDLSLTVINNSDINTRVKSNKAVETRLTDTGNDFGV